MEVVEPQLRRDRHRGRQDLLVDARQQERALLLICHNGRDGQSGGDQRDHPHEQSRAQRHDYSRGSRSVYPTPRTVCSSGGPSESIFFRR